MNPTSSLAWLRRALVATGVVVSAFWLVVIAAAMTWTHPSGSLTRAVTRLARAVGDSPVLGVAFASPLDPGAVRVASSSSTFSYSDDSDELSFAVVDPGHDRTTITGRFDSQGTVGRLSRVEKSPFVWFERDGREYVVRDPDLVRAAREAVEPMQTVGREMGRVGAEQGRRGARMGAIGGRMGALGARMSRLELRASFADMSDADRQATREQVEQLRDEMRSLQREMREAREDRGDDGRSRDALRQRMEELRSKHREAVRECREAMRGVLDRALREGKAERLHAIA